MQVTLVCELYATVSCIGPTAGLYNVTVRELELCETESLRTAPCCGSSW
jgi:hypothetical protein